MRFGKRPIGRIGKISAAFCLLAGLLFSSLSFAAAPPGEKPLVTVRKAERGERPLPLLLYPVEGDLSRDDRKKLDQALEDALYRYTDFQVYPRAAFTNQLGWERQHGTLSCQLPEDCEDRLRENLGLRHEIRMLLVPLADGYINLRLRMDVGDEGDGREFVEPIPELSAAPVILEGMVQDLIGVPPDVRREEGVWHVTSMPLGATVSVEGKEACRTPCSLSGADGETIRVEVRRPEHPPVNEIMKFRRGTVRRWFADLVTRQGEILVDSTPGGAEILLDGRPAGVTPYVVRNVLTGKHTVSLVMSPYPTATYHVDVKADDVTRVRHGFLPEQGTLVIDIPADKRQRNVEIYVNEKKVAENTYRADLPPGSYAVRLVQQGFAACERIVELEPGKSVSIQPEWKPGLALRPGETKGSKNDYRPGAFTTVLGGLLAGFGSFLVARAEDDPNARTATRAAGGTLIGLGAAGLGVGIWLLVDPPQREFAVTPAVDPVTKEVSLNLNWTF